MSVFKLIFTASLLSIMLVLFSCNEPASDFEYRTVTIYSVDTIAIGLLGSVIPVRVDYTVDNLCGEFGRFNESINGKTLLIELEAAYETTKICANEAANKTAYYNFEPTETGEYLLRFRASRNLYINTRITVKKP